MSHNVGADELRVRAHLRQLLDAPTAEPPTTPPRTPSHEPPVRERDWWGPLYQDDRADLDTFTGNTPAPIIPTRPDNTPDIPDTEGNDQDQDVTGQATAKAPKKPKPTAPQAPRQSLLDATARIPRRIRWLTYHASAAGAGWWLGWTGWATDTAAWYAAGHWVSPSAWVLYGLGGLVLALYQRSRAWAWLAAWCAAVPVSSIVLGVLLYAPNS